MVDSVTCWPGDTFSDTFDSGWTSYGSEGRLSPMLLVATARHELVARVLRPVTTYGLKKDSLNV